MEDRIYCKLHVLHAYQPRGQRAEEPAKTNEEIPSFIQKKVKSA
jgi:GcrA cell cycle regulator